MPDKKPEFTEVSFQQNSTASKGEHVRVYGLTNDGKVLLLDRDKAYWPPLLLRAPRESLHVTLHAGQAKG